MARTKKEEPLKEKAVSIKITIKEFKEIKELCKKNDISTVSQFFRTAGKYHKLYLKKKNKEKGEK